MTDPLTATATLLTAGLTVIGEALDVPDSVKVDRSRRLDEDRAHKRGKGKQRAGRRIRRTLAVLGAKEAALRDEAVALGVTL